MARRLAVLMSAVLAILAVVGCSSAADAGTAPHRVTKPPVNGRFDYQIGGAYRPLASVRIVDRDRSDSPVRGRYNICYVNGFQTQAEEDGFWRSKHPGLLLRRTNGTLISDPGWPGEILLDLSSDVKRRAVARIVDTWIDQCAAKGFNAVELDNLDSWTRSQGRLTRKQNMAYASLLVSHAHARGLAAAQKNASELGVAGRTKVHFDFAIAEECQVYSECSDYTKVYGRNVIEIEYTDNPTSAYRTACARRGAQIPVILRDRDVVPRGNPAYRYQAC